MPGFCHRKCGSASGTAEDTGNQGEAGCGRRTQGEAEEGRPRQAEAGGDEGREKQRALGVRQGEAGRDKKRQGEADGARWLIPQNLTADANQSNSSCRTQL